MSKTEEQIPVAQIGVPGTMLQLVRECFPLDAPERTLHSLFSLFAFADRAPAVARAFHHGIYLGRTDALDGPGRELVALLAHPTAFDVDAQESQRSALKKVHEGLGLSLGFLAAQGPDLAPLIFRLLPVMHRRFIIQKGLYQAAPDDKKNDVLLRQMKTFIEEVDAVSGPGVPGATATRTLDALQRVWGEMVQDQPRRLERLAQVTHAGIRAAAGTLLNRVAAFSGTFNYLALLGKVPLTGAGDRLLDDRERAAIIHIATRALQPLSAGEVEALGQYRLEDTHLALKVSHNLAVLSGEYGARADLNPRRVYEMLFDQGPAAGPPDPFLYCWAHRVADVFRDSSRMPDMKVEVRALPALADCWRESGHAPDPQGGLVENLLTLTQSSAAPVFSLEQLARTTGLEETVLRRALFTAEQRKLCWGIRKGRATPTAFLQTLATTFGCAAEDLLPPPEIFSPRPQASAGAAPITSSLWQKAGYGAAEAVFGAFFENPDAAIAAAQAFMGQDGAGTRQALEQALSSPKEAVETNGLPSLPHLWLMWAAKPETAAIATPAAIYAALAKFYGTKTVRALPETAYAHMLWGAVNTAHAGLFKAFSYEDYLSRHLGITKKPETIARALTALEAGDRLTAKETRALGQLEKVAGDVFGRDAQGRAVIGGLLGPVGRRLAARLRAALPAAGTETPQP